MGWYTGVVEVGNVRWTCLEEEEDDQQAVEDWRKEWMEEGVGSRTRAAPWWRDSFEENVRVEGREGVKNKISVDDIYEFDVSDEDVKKLTRKKISKKVPTY